MPPRTDSHFIPIRASDIQRLLSDLMGSERSTFQELCGLLKAMIHFENHDDLLRLKDAYALFDPDADTKQIQWQQDLTADQQSARFFDELLPLFEKANFHRMSREMLEAAIAERSEIGLNLAVDFSVFDRLEIFVRGNAVTERSRRRWQNWFQEEVYEIPVHQRLVLVFRLQPGMADGGGNIGKISLKIFKNIPHGDIEMLLPGTQVRMTLIDRVRIALPTISGLVMTIMKIVKGAFVMAVTGIYGILTMLGLIGGTIGYGVKSFFGYLRTKDRYQADLTRNLYYQNLDNNAGVMCRLLDEVEEQEFREAILAYSVLLLRAQSGDSSAQKIAVGMSLVEVDRAAEKLLKLALERDVDFEADDALQKLIRLGIAQKNGDYYSALSLDEALVKLDTAWDNFFSWNQTQSVQPHVRRAA